MTDHTDDMDQPDVEFFGVKLKVSNPRLATLLNSSVNENVVVIGRRTVDLLARADEDEDDGADPYSSDLGTADRD